MDNYYVVLIPDVKEDNMHKLLLNNNKEVVREIQSYFKKLPDGDFIHRLNAVLLIAHDWDCSSIAKLYKKSIRTIHSWVHTVNQHGIEALKTSHRPGRTSGLTGFCCKTANPTLCLL